MHPPNTYRAALRVIASINREIERLKNTQTVDTQYLQSANNNARTRLTDSLGAAIAAEEE